MTRHILIMVATVKRLSGKRGKRYPRERFTITDKMPVYMVQKTEQMQGIFEEQLNRCGVEYFDYYWLHALGSSNYENVQRVKAFDFIAKEKRRRAKIRHIGFLIP